LQERKLEQLISFVREIVRKDWFFDVFTVKKAGVFVFSNVFICCLIDTKSTILLAKVKMKYGYNVSLCCCFEDKEKPY